ncbi:MAG TPA: hypothetical protein VMB21_09285 [Candidatus Limnocylindria bacterium]|jgi:hypothetical protein|nr:hypothetical protein [Candidatus Limnocylindria bacterium]
MKCLLLLAFGASLGVAGFLRADNAYAAELAAAQARLAAQPTNTTVLIALGKLCHNRATKAGPDATEALKLAEGYLNRLLKLDPHNAFGRALLGSATVITAKEAWLPTTKISRVRRGLAEMDAAVQEAPENENARFTRASNNVFLPDFFDRKGIVLADFAWLQERTDKGHFDTEFRQYVCLYHGVAQAKYGNKAKAEKLWQAGIAIDPKSKVADELRSPPDPGNVAK